MTYGPSFPVRVPNKASHKIMKCHWFWRCAACGRDNPPGDSRVILHTGIAQMRVCPSHEIVVTER